MICFGAEVKVRKVEALCSWVYGTVAMVAARDERVGTGQNLNQA